MKKLKKAVQKAKPPKKQQKISMKLIVGIIILFVSLFIIVIFSNQEQSLIGNAQNISISVSPTFGAIGDCQTMGNCPTVSAAPSGTSIVPTSSISISPTNTSLQPCAATQNAMVTTMSKNRAKSGNNSSSGFLQALLQFFQLLLQLLQQLFGGGTTTPTPIVSQPTQAIQPTQPVQPSPGVQPTTAINPTQIPCAPTNAPVPTTQQPTSVPTSVPMPTTPVTSSSCTTPKYTIPMDPNNAQAGVTIGNFYLTADTWNAANYQLSQTVYACDYNNWYAVANMNNNNGDGAVKTSPNVHEDINKPLSSLKTITSTFAESGPHVGIYEFEYDLWLNGFGNGSTEVMIWNDNFGQTPSGSKQGTFTDNGHTYDVYSTGNGYVAFVAQSNFTSGTVNILNFFNYVVSKGWAASSSTVSQLDYGMELVSTNGTAQTFKVTNFSLTAN